MHLLLRVCSVDRVRTIQCSMQLTAARFRHQLHLSSIAMPQIGVHWRVRDSKMYVERILQNIPNKVVHFIIRTEFSSDYPQKLTFQPCVDL